MDTNTRNRVIAKAVEVFGIGEMASHLGISEALVRGYAIDGQSIPDPVWRLAVSYLMERISRAPARSPAI